MESSHGYTCAVIIAASVFCLPTLAQKKYETLYSRSLTACVEAELEESRITDTQPLAVLKNDIVGEDKGYMYPEQSNIGRIRLEYMDTKSLKERFRRMGLPFLAIRIDPIYTSRDQLAVNCGEYRVSVRKGKVALIARGGFTTWWRFDPSTGDYERTKVERWWPQM